MRQTLGFIAVWCGATVLAISVAWFGVRDVLRSEVFDDASIEPLNAAIGRTGDSTLPPGAPTGPQAVGTPIASSAAPGRTSAPRPTSSARDTAGPRPDRSPSRTAATPVRARESGLSRPGPSASPSRSPSRPAATQAASAPSSSAAPKATATRTQSISTENLRVVNVKGGSVSFAIEDGVCRLIAAAPNAGYEAKVASATGWIRVDLVQGQHGSAVFCIGGENRTDLWEY
ncbi:hypothetical protein AB0F88_14365 [Streptosporangium sp. NPDC023963]|uniref:hypothetical protein n=1 Tax=Streptosporangium sp. NPDC023963 TaxID=3155608 RepID=UPI00343C5448